MPKYEKGRDKTGGRKRGVKNKVTKSMLEKYWKVYDELGGDKEFLRWVRTIKGKAIFYQAGLKMLPSNVTIDPDSELTIKIIEKIVEGNGGEIENNK